VSAVTDPGPLAPMLARNVEQTVLRRAGGALSAEEAARLLGIPHEAVDERRRAGALLSIREGEDWRSARLPV
jgi:DNA-directed RNA polymerase specialized sigma24 family protein